MGNDLRFAGRILRRFKLYSVASAITLAVGIGAATAVFSVIDATLLRPLPYRDPDRLVVLSSVQTDSTGTDLSFSLSQIELVTFRASSMFEGIEAVDSRPVSLVGSGEPVVVTAGAITSGFFDVLGMAPALGRMFSAEEERQNAGVAVLSHSLWTNRFSANPAALGQTIVLGGRAHVIVGVMPQDLRPIFDRSSVWTPLNPQIDAARQNNRSMFTVARLRADVSAAQAQAELTTLSLPLATQFPAGHRRAKPAVQALHENLFGPRAPALWMLGFAVLALLTLACANVANLTLGHLSMRQGELATRSLVGAGAARILRLLIVQTALLAIIGGALGLACVTLLLPPLVALYNANGAAAITLRVDWRVLAVSIGVIAGAALLCAAMPAWKIHRAALAGGSLRMAAVRFSAGRWERRVRGTLVSAQVAIAVALLCASGTLFKSLNSMLATSPGFPADRVLTMQMLLPTAIYPDVQARAAVVKRMLERVERVPGVLAVGTTQSTFLPAQSMRTMMHVEGIHTEEPERSHIRHITPGYFAAMQVPVIEGRAIDLRDEAGFPPVCMVSQTFAKRYFPNGSAVGHRVRRARAVVAWMTIVGVAGDVRDEGLATDPGPVLYVPYLQDNTPTARVSLVARTQGDPTQLANSVREAIWEIDRNQPIDRVASLEDVFLEGASAERFRTLLVGLFAFGGLTLAIIGVYAVTAASVTARTWEAALRLALGARPWTLAARMVREASTQIVTGVAAGVTAFSLLGRLLSGLLYQTSAADPSIIAGAALTTIVLAVLAAAWQARRLAKVSPAVGLRA